MMNRRAFLCRLTLGTLLVALAAEAQTHRIYRLAYVNSASETEERKPHLQAFRVAMRDHGYVESANFNLQVRYADSDSERLRAMVNEVIGMKPDILLGFEDAALVMRAKTTSIPIVLTGALDPVKAGLAQTLARPGLNVTGSTQLMDQLVVKHIEILREILPRRISRIGQLVDTTARGCLVVAEQARAAAQSVGVVFVQYDITTRNDIAEAFSQMRKEQVAAVLPCPSPMLFSFRQELFDNALRQYVPLTSFVTTNVPPGVLFAYAATIEEGYRRAAGYVDKILKGAKPGDLPIEQPTHFRLVFSLKTAKALGLTIPPSLLLRADQVIE
jgi:putative ABC transport system substrate-binding protein